MAGDGGVQRLLAAQSPQRVRQHVAQWPGGFHPQPAQARQQLGGVAQPGWVGQQAATDGQCLGVPLGLLQRLAAFDQQSRLGQLGWRRQRAERLQGVDAGQSGSKLAGAQPHFGQLEQRHRVVRGQRLHAQECQFGMPQPLLGNQNPAQLAQAVQPVGGQLQGDFNGGFGFMQPLLLVAHLRQCAPGFGVFRGMGHRLLGAARRQRAVAGHGMDKRRLNLRADIVRPAGQQLVGGMDGCRMVVLRQCHPGQQAQGFDIVGVQAQGALQGATRQRRAATLLVRDGQQTPAFAVVGCGAQPAQQQAARLVGLAHVQQHLRHQGLRWLGVGLMVQHLLQQPLRVDRPAGTRLNLRTAEQRVALAEVASLHLVKAGVGCQPVAGILQEGTQQMPAGHPFRVEFGQLPGKGNRRQPVAALPL